MKKEEKNTAIFVAYEDMTGYDIAKPEKDLLLAVLMSAISDLKKRGGAKRQASDFFLGDQRKYLFSFESICEHLDLDPKTVLTIAGLRKGEKKQASRQRWVNN